jgi:multisubunit Na+/H+ antiporter MnhC subunit
VSAALVTGVLAAAGVYLALQRGLVRIVIGVFLAQHAANLLLVTARAPQRDAAPILPVESPADPLGQAFVLTAIVIGLASAIFLLALALRDAQVTGETVTEDADDPDRDTGRP